MLRFWETKFPQLRPLKRGGGRRYYRPEDIRLLRRIRQCLYQDGYTIRGVQQLLENRPPGTVAAGEDPDIAGPFAAAPGADRRSRHCVGGRRSMRRTGCTPPRRAVPHRKPQSLDPETRAELDEIRRELLQARALLDALLRRSKTDETADRAHPTPRRSDRVAPRAASRYPEALARKIRSERSAAW